MRSAKDIEQALLSAMASFTGEPSKNPEIRAKVDPLVESFTFAWENNNPQCRVAWQRIVSACSASMFDNRLSLESRADWMRELEFQTNQVRAIALQSMKEGKPIPADLEDLAPELPAEPHAVEG